jgi:NAD(P)-dependent dehydrogenase (short-subunit alcohol dehydrogenase family)
MSQKTVLITGVSSGLGRAFAIELLNAGYRIVGTVAEQSWSPSSRRRSQGRRSRGFLI